MYIDISPSLDQLSASKQAIGSADSNRQDALRSLREIAGNTTLQGEAYSAIKERVNATDIPLAQGYVVYCAYLASLYDVQAEHINSSFSNTSIRMDTGEIQGQIDLVQEEINKLAVEMYKSDLFRLFPLYRTMVEIKIVSLKGLIRELENKLREMESYYNATAGLYDEAIAIANTLKQGVRYSGSLMWQNGRWHSPIGWPNWNLDLDIKLKEAWKQVTDRARKYVYNSALGRFGGSQKGPLDHYGFDDPELKEILGRYPGFEGFAGDEVLTRSLLGRIYRTACGYTALANSVMEQYYFRPDDFERDFGFPLFRDEGGDKSILNFEPLIVDMYCAYAQSKINDLNTPPSQDEIIGIHCYGILPGENSFFSDYIADKSGASVAVSLEDYETSMDLNEKLKEGHVIISAAYPSVYYATDTDTKPAWDNLEFGEAHATSLIQADDSGNNAEHVFSSWGNEFKVSDLGLYKAAWKNDNGDIFRFKDNQGLPSYVFKSGEVKGVATNISVIKWELP
jgi:hypothetical protein